MKALTRTFSALALAALVGCGAALSVVSEVINDNTLLAGVAAHKATTTVIELADDPQARAQRILNYTEFAVELVDSDVPVTLDRLYIQIHGMVMAQVPEIDRQPAEDMLDALRDALAREIDEFAILTPATEVSLLHVISRIRVAAELYA